MPRHPFCLFLISIFIISLAFFLLLLLRNDESHYLKENVGFEAALNEAERQTVVMMSSKDRPWSRSVYCQ